MLTNHSRPTIDNQYRSIINSSLSLRTANVFLANFKGSAAADKQIHFQCEISQQQSNFLQTCKKLCM